MIDSTSYEIPHHHHSVPASSSSSLFPIHHNSQLEVCLPISPHDITTSGISSTGINSIPHHPMVTRLKSGTIKKKNYAAYLATFPELQTLQLIEDEPFSGGFSFVTQVIDVIEPSNFRKRSNIPQWQQAMQKEYDSLRAHGTWKLVPAPDDRSIVGSKWVYKVKKNPDGNVQGIRIDWLHKGFLKSMGWIILKH